MTQTRLMMGMPITVTIEDKNYQEEWFNQVFDFFDWVDKKFSPFKPTSELSQINSQKILPSQASPEMKLILKLCQQTKKDTQGYFDIFHNGKIDTSGVVKGWAIHEAAKLLKKLGSKKFFVNAGGDIQAVGKKWTFGIQNPFNRSEIVKTVTIKNKGLATSGNYIRGNHIYNPKTPNIIPNEIVSISVIGPNIYEADRMATAAFAMGKKGIKFIQELPGFAGYMIDKDGKATFTTNFVS